MAAHTTDRDASWNIFVSEYTKCQRPPFAPSNPIWKRRALPTRRLHLLLSPKVIRECGRSRKERYKKGKSLGRRERPFYSFHLLFLCRRVEKGEKNRGRGGALQKSRGKERQEPVMERDSTTMEELSVSFVTESTENATKVSKKGF